MSEEQKIIDLENEISFLKDALCEKQKEIEENQVLIDDIKDHRIVYIDTPEFEEKFISKDKIREKIEEIESFDKAMHQKNGQFTILVLQGLLKEEDGDHIPRID